MSIILKQKETKARINLIIITHTLQSRVETDNLLLWTRIQFKTTHGRMEPLGTRGHCFGTVNTEGNPCGVEKTI